jgi:hypothetical protein
VLPAVDTEVERNYELIVPFAKDRKEADPSIESILKSLVPDGPLWFCYSKGSSKKYKSDINRNKAWDLFKPCDFRPVAQVSIDEDWSGLRFRQSDLVK